MYIHVYNDLKNFIFIFSSRRYAMKDASLSSTTRDIILYYNTPTKSTTTTTTITTMTTERIWKRVEFVTF